MVRITPAIPLYGHLKIQANQTTPLWTKQWDKCPSDRILAAFQGPSYMLIQRYSCQPCLFMFFIKSPDSTWMMVLSESQNPQTIGLGHQCSLSEDFDKHSSLSPTGISVSTGPHSANKRGHLSRVNWGGAPGRDCHLAGQWWDKGPLPPPCQGLNLDHVSSIQFCVKDFAPSYLLRTM